MIPELLAPAGSMEALIAAVRCGADAVYVGAARFSARQHAENFDKAALQKAASLCHLYGAKLHLALNTMVFDDELSALCTLAQGAAECGVDAMIVQDLGVLSLLRSLLPDMPLHASTQMSLHTVEGVLQAKALGCSRVVAARELPLSTLREMADTGVEIEAFCHGALCMGVSGQCYLSAMVGSRSANRGLCAQACRLPFTAGTNPAACALSLKDQSLTAHVWAMADAGIASLKIEGRMKRPEYVAAAVTAYRQALSGEEPDLERLRAVFSRSGFTDGYLTGKRTQMFGVREKEDVTAAKAVLPELQGLYRKPRKAARFHSRLFVGADTPSALEAWDDDGNRVRMTGEVPQAALHAPLDAQRVIRQLQKLGDTIYAPGDCTVDAQPGLMLPASALNALRRDAAAALDAARIAANTAPQRIGHLPPATPATPLPTTHTLRLQVTKAEQLSRIPAQQYECAIVPIAEASKLTLPKDKILLQPPRFVTDEAALVTALTALHEKGYRDLLCENPAQIRIGARLGFALHGGSDLHIANSAAMAELARLGLVDCTVSFECKLSQIAGRASALPCGMLAYGHLPLMLMRNCPIREEIGCQNCRHRLQDRTKRSFPVYCTGKQYAELLNAECLYLADRPESMAHVSFCTLRFLEETPEHAAAVTAAYAGTAPADPPPVLTRGLYYRGVQ